MPVSFAGQANSAKYKDKEAYIKYEFKRNINVQSSHLIYTELSLLAEMGGYMGLLLGVSLLDISSIFNTLFIMIRQKHVKIFEKNLNKISRLLGKFFSSHEAPRPEAQWAQSPSEGPKAQEA